MNSISIFGYDITISELITDALAIFLFGLYALRTKGLKNILKELSGMITKFKTLQTLPETVGQTTETTKPVFRLNKSKNELEKTDETIDLQAVIESSLEAALNRVLDRLLPVMEEDKNIQEYETMTDDIDKLVEVQNIAEDYRERYNLPVDFTVEQIFSFVDKKATELYSKVYEKKVVGGNSNEKTPSVEESK